MRNKREHIRHAAVLILAVAGLIICTAPFSTSSGLASAQADAQSWSYTGSLKWGHNGIPAMLLPDGKVLVVGRPEVELYDPSTGTWSVNGRLKLLRQFYTATLLGNGKVLVAGGYDVISDDPPELTNTAELYDPATGESRFTGNLNVRRVGHTARLLPNGKVLFAGGVIFRIVGGRIEESTTNTAELYDPATGQWNLTGNLSTARTDHAAALLQNGKVLVAGGYLLEGGQVVYTASAEVYDPNTETWSSTGSLNTPRGYHTLTTLPNGNVLVSGGEGNALPFKLNTTEIYNPATGLWSTTGTLNTARGHHTATLLQNGKVLVVGGIMINTAVYNSAELYDPATGTCKTTADLNTARYNHSATLLSDGKVLVVGGADDRRAELYDSGSSSTLNPIDDTQFFARQQYLDFLNREPDAPGLAHWAGEITGCNDPSRRQPGESLALCIERKRPDISAAFFLSPEFQYTGYFVYRLYKGSLIQNGAGRVPTYQEFLRDGRQVASGIIQNNQLSASTIEANKKTFAEEFTKRAEFRSLYDPLSNFDYVERLFQTTGINVSTTEKQALVAGLNNQTETRASVLQKIVDGAVVIAEGNQQFTTPYSQAFYEKEFNAAFVLMEYFGYLHRDPDAAGYQFWLGKLNLYGNFNDAEMVKSFIVSPEYRARFGQP